MKVIFRAGLVCLILFAAIATERGAAQQIPELRSLADPARLAGFAQALEQNLGYVPGELLVKFRDGVDSRGQVAALRVLGNNTANGSQQWLGETLLLSGVTMADLNHAAALLTAQPEVAYAHPNYLRRLHSVPNEPFYARQWNLDDIHMPGAWDLNVSAGRGVTVAVLDSGLTTLEGTVGARLPVSLTSYAIFPIPFARNPDIDFSRVMPGADFSFTGPWQLTSGQSIQFDADGHGSHVAGTVAQWTNNSLGFAGVANGATLLPIKICSSTLDVIMAWGRDGQVPSDLEGGCDSVALIQGLRYAADNGAKVINMSVGGTLQVPAERDALIYAVSKGAFIAISAGNEALDGNPIEFPAAYGESINGVVAVGATTVRRTRALYSNYRSYVELAAPGGAGGAGGCAGPGELIWQTAPRQTDLQVLPPRFDRYGELGICGTSMAAPHVAGAAALLYSQGITNPAAIEAALERFAVDLGPAGRDVEFGHGLIDVRAALRGLGVAR